MCPPTAQLASILWSHCGTSELLRNAALAFMPAVSSYAGLRVLRAIVHLAMTSEAHANEVGKPLATVAAVAVAIRPANAGNRRFADWREQAGANPSRDQGGHARE